MKFISIGGWCGTTISLRVNNLYDEAYPFDYIRSTFEGVINCIETNFDNFFPKKIELDIIENDNWKSYRGKYFGFYHHDLQNSKIIDNFNRRINRFNNLLKETDNKIIFIRTISTHDYNDEIKLANSFIKATEDKFPLLEFLLIFVIPGQDKSMFYKKINKNTFIFTLNDKSEDNNNLGTEYKPIYDYLKTNNLFKVTPDDNIINIKNGKNRFVEVNDVSITRNDN